MKSNLCFEFVRNHLAATFNSSTVCNEAHQESIEVDFLQGYSIKLMYAAYLWQKKLNDSL